MRHRAPSLSAFNKRPVKASAFAESISNFFVESDIPSILRTYIADANANFRQGRGNADLMVDALSRRAPKFGRSADTPEQKPRWSLPNRFPFAPSLSGPRDSFPFSAGSHTYPGPPCSPTFP